MEKLYAAVLSGSQQPESRKSFRSHRLQYLWVAYVCNVCFTLIAAASRNARLPMVDRFDRQYSKMFAIQQRTRCRREHDKWSGIVTEVLCRLHSPRVNGSAPKDSWREFSGGTFCGNRRPPPKQTICYQCEFQETHIFNEKPQKNPDNQEWV